ncbi:MAG: S8 family serine peptidase [Ignavibacteriales bacterium]|nr:S8 family serine peptidase [Ignavibacteriales bacterium]
MKFKIIVIIVFSVNTIIFSQTKYFIKFNSNLSVTECESIIEQKFYVNSLAKRSKQFYYSLAKNTTTFKSKFDNIFIVDFSPDQNNLLIDFRNDPSIVFLQQSLIYKIDTLPSDSLYSEQWGLQNIGAEKAWDLIPQNAEKIILAIIDTGIDYFHPDLKDQFFVNPHETGIDNQGNDKSTNGIDDDGNGFIDDFSGWDFVNKVNSISNSANSDFFDWDNDPIDENGHGTNVAGIIGARHNSIGIAGVNQNIQILNLRAFDKNGNGDEDDVASAIIYAVNMGAKIINMSWGDSEYSQILKDVIDYADSKGVVLVASSGNSGSDLPHFPSGFNNVISVGAIQKNETLAGFSNFGSSIDLVAPGSQIITTDLNNSYKNVSGTSASAPFVSASASILLSYNSFSSEEVKQILKTTAKDLGNLGWDEKYGAGNLNLSNALSLLLPSEFKINFPENDYCTNSNELTINITCISPLFKNYKIQYGIGFNPLNWNDIDIENNEYQVLNENIHTLNLKELIDTVYAIRLIVNTINERTFEERSSFVIDRTKPKIISYFISPALLNDNETIQASIITDDKTTAQIFYRKKNSDEKFNSIYLDNFSSEIKIISQKHHGFLPNDIIQNPFEIEFYFVLTNQAGLKYSLFNNDNYFTIESSLEKNTLLLNKKPYSLPIGRIFPEQINFLNIDNNYVFINENTSPADLSIYKFENGQFVKTKTLKNRIPVSFGNFNNDETNDILSLFVKNGYIETQAETDKIEFKNVFADSTQNFWPANVEDLDKDQKTEIIAFSSDSTFSIWEVQNDYSIILEKELKIFNTNQSTISNASFRNNQAIVGDFDSDGKNEILISDNFGRMFFYEIENDKSYKNDFILENQFNLDANCQIAKGDFNGDGILDFCILTKFEDDSFINPISNLTVYSIIQGNLEILFEKMLITTDEITKGVSDKSYSSLRLKDLTGDSKEEIIVSQNPNLYIFEYEIHMPKLLFYQSNINSQSIFIGDLDGNSVNDIGIPNEGELFFKEIENIFTLPTPVITDFYNYDSSKNFIQWQNNDFMVKIYKGNSNNDLVLYDSTSTNYFIDSINTQSINYYAVEYWDKNDFKVSSKSKIIELVSHAPGVLEKINVKNKNSIEILFSLPLNQNSVKLNNLSIDDIIPNSIVFNSENSFIIYTKNELQNGTHKFKFVKIRDIYNSPFYTESENFLVNSESIEENKLFIQNYKLLDNFNISITFNLNLDTVTVLNKNNYSISPNNLVNIINFQKGLKNSIIITVKKPVGAIGKESILTLTNILSSKETGNIGLKENSGGQIFISGNAENLNDVFVYPNPVKLNDNNQITFANLTQNTEIYVFSLSGELQIKLIKDDGDGGISWNLINLENETISSGIYFYKIISFDSDGNKKETKMNKFAVIK